MSSIKKFVKSTFNIGESSKHKNIFRRDGRYAHGHYSIASFQAHDIMEDHFTMVLGENGDAFIGVYDGHNGSSCSRYLRDNLFRKIKETSLEDDGLVTHSSLTNAIGKMETGFCEQSISEFWSDSPPILPSGACLAVPVFQGGEVLIANLGQYPCGVGRTRHEPCGDTHNRPQHKREPHVTFSSHTLVIQMLFGRKMADGKFKVSRTIGDVHLKDPRYLPENTRLPGPHKPLISALPAVHSLSVPNTDSVFIIASAGLWMHLTHEETMQMVFNSPKKGIAKRLVKAARAKTTGSHEDITVIVLRLDANLVNQGSGSTVFLQSELTH